MEVWLHPLLTSALGGEFNFTLRPLQPPGKVLRHPLNTSLCAPQRRFGRFGEDRNLLLLPGFDPRIIQPLASRCAIIRYNILNDEEECLCHPRPLNLEWYEH